jgi:hypothetical protein
MDWQDAHSSAPLVHRDESTPFEHLGVLVQNANDEVPDRVWKHVLRTNLQHARARGTRQRESGTEVEVVREYDVLCNRA